MGLIINEFKEGLNQFLEKEVPQEWMRRQIEIIIFLFNDIREHTPVAPDKGSFKGGFARYNWRVTMNTPPTDVLGKRGSPPQKRSLESIRQSLSTMKRGLRSYQKAADVLYVYNNVPYVTFLEHGWSDQAPEGMVMQGIENTRAFIRNKGWG